MKDLGWEKNSLGLFTNIWSIMSAVVKNIAWSSKNLWHQSPSITRILFSFVFSYFIVKFHNLNRDVNENKHCTGRWIRNQLMLIQVSCFLFVVDCVVPIEGTELGYSDSLVSCWKNFSVVSAQCNHALTDFFQFISNSILIRCNINENNKEAGYSTQLDKVSHLYL